jgi:hypothetical protein
MDVERGDLAAGAVLPPSLPVMNRSPMMMLLEALCSRIETSVTSVRHRASPVSPSMAKAWPSTVL